MSTLNRKRKRADDRILLGDSFHVQPHSSSPFDASIHVVPTVILPRAHIPLHWIAGTPSRLFSLPTDIPALSVANNVAIVKIEGERQLSAVQRFSDDIHVLYRLSTQVKLKDVRNLFAQLNKPIKSSSGAAAKVPPPADSWWSDVEQAALPSSLLSKELAPGPTECLKGRSLSRSPSPQQGLSTTAPKEPAEPSQFSRELFASDPLESLRLQYYEALYLAKTSLAYFTKSTLSRARARADFQHSEAKSPNTLADFLQQLVLPLDRLDTKYRVSLPNFIKDETTVNSMYLRESERPYLDKWRSSIFGEVLVRKSDSEIRQSIHDLKARETELQVIILLETLSLASPGLGRGDPERSSLTNKASSKRKGKSKHSNQHPSRLLELLVDRLCIWYSISSGTKEDDTQTKAADAENGKDHLRHFCVDVIMTFYGSKLPEQCASINRKFNGYIGRGTRDSRKNRPDAVKTRVAAVPGCVQEKPDSLAAVSIEMNKRTSRGGTLNSNSFTKRLVRVGSGTASKRIDEELKSAIQALTKPNRAVVASEIVTEAEQRLAQAAKKPKRPPNHRSNSVLVTATPRKARQKASVEGIPETPVPKNFSVPQSEPQHLMTPTTGAGLVASTPVREPRQELGTLDSELKYTRSYTASTTPKRPLVAAQGDQQSSKSEGNIYSVLGWDSPGDPD